MRRIRAFEEAAYALFLRGLVKGTTHLAIGQEAVAVGVSAALRADDYVLATYRGHHHVLARGASVEASMAELLGRGDGLCGGKGGSMHLTSAAHGMLGSYAIVGAQLPIACGAAWSAKLRKTDQVTVAFMGDGATNIGAFHEALNLAAVWRLPVVFVCENNLYMEYTPIASVIPVEHPAHDRAPAYGMTSELIDGNDVVAVNEAASRAIDRARAGSGPSLIEALTYRLTGHSRADPAKYRPAGELEAWQARDPLLVARRRLEDSGIENSHLDGLDAEIDADVSRAVELAITWPATDLAAAWTDTYADGASEWRT
ncbi:MAG: thiamine pyrophosphate-dependent dehydrogenase E1 component subunit alpha [Chloroflexota bacterium]